MLQGTDSRQPSRASALFPAAAKERKSSSSSSAPRSIIRSTITKKAVGSPLPATIIGGDQWRGVGQEAPTRPIAQAVFEIHPQAAANVFIPRQKALDIYNSTLDRLHLDMSPRRTKCHLRRNDAAGRKTQRGSAQRHGLGLYDRNSGSGGARRISIRAGFHSVWNCRRATGKTATCSVGHSAQYSLNIPNRFDLDSIDKAVIERASFHAVGKHDGRLSKIAKYLFVVTKWCARSDSNTRPSGS